MVGIDFEDSFFAWMKDQKAMPGVTPTKMHVDVHPIDPESADTGMDVYFNIIDGGEEMNIFLNREDALKLADKIIKAYR